MLVVGDLDGRIDAADHRHEISRAVFARNFQLEFLLRFHGRVFATVAGLLVAACEPQATCDMPLDARMAIDRSQMTYAKRVGKWLAEAF